jgi:hypothetical protein
VLGPLRIVGHIIIVGLASLLSSVLVEEKPQCGIYEHQSLDFYHFFLELALGR